MAPKQLLINVCQNNEIMFIAVLFYILSALMVFFAYRFYFNYWKKNGLVATEEYPFHVFLLIIAFVLFIIASRNLH